MVVLWITDKMVFYALFFQYLEMSQVEDRSKLLPHRSLLLLPQGAPLQPREHIASSADGETEQQFVPDSFKL